MEVIDPATARPATDDIQVAEGTSLRARVPESVKSSVPLLIAIFALGAYASTHSDYFLTSENIQNLVQQISVLGVITVGMTFLMVAGYLDLSVGTLASLISVIGAQMAVDGHGEPAIVVVAVCVGVAAGLVTGFVVGAMRIAPFILTLGTLSVYQSLGLIISNGQPVPVDEYVFSSLGLGRWFGVPASAVVLAMAVVVGGIVLRFTRVGRSAYAIGSNPQAAFLSGISIVRVTLVLYAMSGALVGVAGVILLGRLGAGDPTTGAGLELQSIAAVVLGGAALSGGRGSILGSILGVILLGMIANSLNILGVVVFYQQLVYGSVLIVAVIASGLRDPSRPRTRLERRIAARAGSVLQHLRRSSSEATASKKQGSEEK